MAAMSYCSGAKEQLGSQGRTETSEAARSSRLLGAAGRGMRKQAGPGKHRCGGLFFTGRQLKVTSSTWGR